jgi:integrase
MSIDKRPDGRWRARWREYPGGPQKARHFTRKVDAERHLAETKVALARGSYLTADQLRVTLGQYVSTHLGRQVWRERTMDLARVALDRAEAHFGTDRPLTAIRRGDVEGFVVKLSADVAPSTARVVFQHFRTLMRSALADGIIVLDPTIKIRLPQLPANELVIPTTEQVHALIAGAPEDFAAAIVLGAYVGLRAGEAQGLFVDDIDFLRRTVNVRRQLDGRSTKMVLVEPKTRASTRSVPVPQPVLEVLAEHVRVQGRGRDGVLLHRDGEYLSDNQFNWSWRTAQKGAGLPAGSLRFHWLRHSFASALISAGCSVKAVADAMGHQNPTITLRTYASLWPGDEDRIRGAVGLAWQPQNRRADSESGA